MKESTQDDLTTKAFNRGLCCVAVAGTIALLPLLGITASRIFEGYKGMTRVELINRSNQKSRVAKGVFHNPRRVIVRDQDEISRLDLHLLYLGERRDILAWHYDFLFLTPRKEVNLNLNGLVPGRYLLKVLTRDRKGNETYRELPFCEDLEV